MKTKILYISGDDDYHFLTFEQQSKFTLEQIIQICKTTKDKPHRFDIDEDDYFDAELFEFNEVDKNFIEFIKSKQDYDDSKHHNWIVIE